jgi:hypothetical protein
VPLLARHCDVLSRLVKARPRFAPRRSFEVVLRCIGGIMWVTPATSTVIACSLMLRPGVGAFILNVSFTFLLHECATRSHGRGVTNRIFIKSGKTCYVRLSLFVPSVYSSLFMNRATKCYTTCNVCSSSKLFL